MTHMIEYTAIGLVDSAEQAKVLRCIEAFNLRVEHCEHTELRVLQAQRLTPKVLAEIGDFCLRHGNCSILLVTYESDPAHLVKAYNSGIHEHLGSIVNASLLAIKIERILQSRQAEHLQNEKNQKLEEVLTRIQQEESFAHHVYQEITGGAMNTKKDYFSLQRSASGFCGDFLFDMRSPTGIRYVFLADAMGHGLAAALSILPVIHVVKAMAHRSMPISTILHEVNRRLNIELPDDRFVTLAAIEVSPFSHKISVVNAGLPSIFVGLADGTVSECNSQCIPLGIAQGAAFSFTPYLFELDQVDSLLMYTDGFIEQENHKGESIGKVGVRNALEVCNKEQQPWKSVANLFRQHAADVPLADDVTFCAINFSEFELSSQDEQQGDKRVGSVSLTLDISGDYLNSVDVPAFVSKYLYAAGIEGKLAGKTFTAVAELYQNGLDHGVLNLDSNLKNDIEGFSAYLEQRELALANMTDKDNVSLTLNYAAESGITAAITDTGNGYDVQTINPEQFSLFGRGLALVRQLCESFDTNESGNQVSVNIKD